jgi:hypothetical protein
MDLLCGVQWSSLVADHVAKQISSPTATSSVLPLIDEEPTEIVPNNSPFHNVTVGLTWSRAVTVALEFHDANISSVRDQTTSSNTTWTTTQSTALEYQISRPLLHVIMLSPFVVNLGLSADPTQIAFPPSQLRKH